jgi:hypothetical protein
LFVAGFLVFEPPPQSLSHLGRSWLGLESFRRSDHNELCLKCRVIGDYCSLKPGICNVVMQVQVRVHIRLDYALDANLSKFNASEGAASIVEGAYRVASQSLREETCDQSQLEMPF